MAIAAVMSLGVSAQLVSSNTLTNKASKNYSRLSVSYNSISMDKDLIDGGMNGFSLAWTKGISVSSTTPLFIETGLGATYAFKSDDAYGVDISNKFLGVTIPVNLAYKWNVSNTDINLIPFVGVYLRGNLYGNTKYEYNGDDEDYDWFDDYEDGGMEAARFSFGWNIGVGFEYSKLYVGLSYGSDFNEFVEKADKPGIFSATVGLNF